MSDSSVEEAARPGRPLGVSLAVLLSAGLFALLPLFRLGVDLYVESRFLSLEDVAVSLGDEVEMTPLLVGGDVTLVTLDRLLLEGLPALGFFILAIFAWRGRPVWMRLVFFTSVVALAMLNLLLIVFSASQPQAGMDSFQATSNTLLCGQVVLLVLVPLYVVWYLNRGPARAFYRGYYLEREKDPPLS